MYNFKSSLLRFLVSSTYDFSIKTGVMKYTLFNKYKFMFTPMQLFALCDAIRKTKDLKGCFVEIGCAFGHTTVFLNKFIEENGIDRPYIAIDTFSGFLERDIEHEKSERGKTDEYENIFINNKKEWFQEGLKESGVDSVDVVKSDAAVFDYQSIAPIACCLLDIDLYNPIKEVLPKVFDALVPGGVIIVDDCSDGGKWDGAYQAYIEFMDTINHSPQIIHEKLGIITK